VGLECFQVDCPGGGTTSVSGIVHAPNGTLPLYNVTVYVPNTGAVDAFDAGAQCDRCGTVLSGNPLVKTTTDTEGRFLLTDMPVTGDVRLVVQVGKWRRQYVIPQVAECVDTPLAADELRLPRNQSEGDIPLMALTTGSADALECLLRKIGLDDNEFTAAGGTGRVHLYTGNGTDQFDAAQGNGAFTNATSLWGTDTEAAADITARLDDYDVLLLSCESGQHAETKPAPALEAMKAYADLGGRMFLSHWHNYWIQLGPTPWPDVMDFDFQPDLGDVTADVNTGFERGAALADWLLHVDASTTLGQIDILDTQHTVTAVDPAYGERWIYKDVTANDSPSVQYMSMTTPLEVEPEDRCGRAVFSDIHVSSGDDSASTLAFPSGGCVTPETDLTNQEKVLAFMIFDIASCVGPDVE